MDKNDTAAAKRLDSTTTSLTYTATSGKGSTAYTTITINFPDINQESLGATVATTFETRPGGSFTVDGEAITAKTQKSKVDTESYELVATPETGYKLFGWMSSDGPLNTAGTTTYTYTAKKEATIWPLFIKLDSAVYYIQGASPAIYYGFLDDAITAAGSSGTILPYQSGTVYGNNVTTFDLNGQTILLPYEENATLIATKTATDDSGSLGSTWIHANNTFISDQYDDGNANNSSVTGVMEPNTSVYRTLTIPVGTTVNVNSGSKFVIGGRIVSGTTNTGGVCGATAGAHSNVVVNGTLNVRDTTPDTANDEGILSCCGYILGGGDVNIVGGRAYQPFTMMDYHDGHYTANSTKNANFPVYRYILHNIRADVTVSSGGRMYAYIDIYTQETNVYVTTIKARHNVDCQMVIGTASDSQCLIKLTSGATLAATYDSTDYVTTTSNQAGSQYYSKAGKTHLTINGGATWGYMGISVYVPIIGAQTAQTNGVDFPVPYHYDITLEEGDYTIPYNLILFPGASMTVEEGADLVVSGGKFVALDGLRDYSSRSASISIGSWYEYHYPSTANFKNNHSKKTYNGTANLIVNGTMTVNSGASFGGYVQTNGTGQVTIKGETEATVGVGNVKCYGTPVNKFVGRIETTLGAWLWKTHGDQENVIKMESGKTYYGVDGVAHTIGTYTYKVYTAPDDTGTYTGVGVTGSGGKVDHAAETLNANIVGSWCTVKGHDYADEVTEPTCTAAGYTTHTCSGCQHSYTDAETAATGHTEVVDEAVAATCATTGLTQGSHCSVCDEVLIAQQEIAKKDHTPGSAATCEADQSCTVCGYVIVSASGVHDPAVQGSLCFHKAMIGDAPYETLAAAVDAYSTGYIKMIDDSTETNCVIDGEVYLDLAGKSVTGSVSIGDGGVLYGFDTTTDGYDKRGGSITLTGEPEAVTESPITEGWVYAAYTADSGDGAKTYTFNRTSVYVSDYYMEIIADGTAKVGFAGVFRGNADAALVLQDLGFEVNKEEITNGARPDGVQDKFRFSYTATATDYGDYAVKGLMEFGGTTLTSQYPRSFNFTNVLKSYYANKADEKAKAVIKLFAGKNGITL